jgi:DNA-binding beta-propeller fold protein YncE
LLGTFSVGDNPRQLAFDGANIWVSNLADDTVARLRASDGTVLGTLNAGRKPWEFTLMGLIFGW